MKKVTSLLLLVGVAAFGLVACGDNVVPPDGGNVEGVTVTPSVLNIAVGGSGSLSADVDGDPNNAVTWSSNNEAVATVDGDGNVTGVSEGNAAVTATSTVDNGHSASAEINVTATEKAQVSIASITNAAGGPINVNNVAGQINVTLNVSEGDQSIESVELLVDGEVASSQDFVSANIVEGAEAQGEVSQLTFNFRTDRAPAGVEMDGTPVEGEFQNGERVISGQVTLSNGNSREATNSQTLNFNNTNRVVVAHLSGGQGIVGNGARYWGNEDITLATTPITFTAQTVGAVTLDPNAGTQTANGAGAADLGGGSGTAVTDSEAPFQFTIAADDNVNGPEDLAGADDGLGGVGHDFLVTALEDTDGVALPLGDFDIENLNDFFLDFVAPVVDVGGASEITQDGVDIMADLFYNEGPFGVSNLSELGVGGTAIGFDADVISTGADPDYEDVSSFADLDEHGDAATPPTPSDVKVIVTDIADALGNATDIDPATGTPVDATGADAVDAEDNASEYHGVDHTAPDASNQLPASGGSATYVFNGDGTGFPGGTGDLNVDIVDPTLADGNAPSLKNDATAMFEIQDDAGMTLYGPVANVDAAFNTATPTYSGNPSVTTDGPRVAIFTFEDNAVDPNDAEQVFEYILDTTPPSFGALNPAPASTATQATSVLQDIGGTVTDANVISTATVTVRVTGALIGDHDDGDPSDGAPDADAICEATDELLDVDNGDLVTGNNRDISNGTNSIDFSETFEINDPFPAGTGTVKYCYFISATDEALDNAGDPNGNSASLSTESEIEWQN